jgi:P2 family phage contractile tail tube protein
MRDILKFVNVFVDGYGYAGVVKNFEPPKIEQATREFAAAGMAGPVGVRLGRLANVLEVNLQFEGFDPNLYRALDIREGADIPLTLKGSTEDRDGITHAHAHHLRGFIKSYDEGTWEDGQEVPLKLIVSLSYYKRLRDGEELWEIEPEGMIWKKNGVDMLAQHRANIGR